VRRAKTLRAVVWCGWPFVVSVCLFFILASSPGLVVVACACYMQRSLRFSLFFFFFFFKDRSVAAGDEETR
jgi:hypothetical protein